jgi:ATP-dependent Lhr-like helicase
VRRRTLAAIRRAVEPVEADALGRFVPAWQGVGRDAGRGLDRLRDVVAQLQGVALPVSAWESDVLPLRVPRYRTDMLDELCAGGELVWVGAGQGRAALYLRGETALLHTPAEVPEHPIVAALRGRGPMFFADLAMAVGEPDRTVLAELWMLAWAGAVTNDSWHPLRGGAVLRALPPPGPVRAGRVARRARPTSSLPAARGRWSLVESLVPAAPAPAERARALAETLLDRHGVLTRAAVLAEGIPGGFAAVYGELRMMEEAGRCQRGYFVEGLGGAQFAAPTAVERLRDVRDADPDAPAVVLSAIDPANPYGAALPWPAAARRPARVAGSWVVMAAGRPALYVERGGRGLVTFDAELLEPAVAALSDLVDTGRARRLAPERIDGEPIAGTEAERLLLAHGFLKGHRRLVLRA